MSITNHAKEGKLLQLAVDGPIRVENFVSAVLRISLSEHHQLYVIWVTA